MLVPQRGPRTVPLEIPDKTYFKIGEAAKLVDIKPYIIRYWESEFRYLRPAKTKSRQRLFRRKDIELLMVIKTLLYEQKFTIDGARQQLKHYSAAGLSYGDILEQLEAGQPAVTQPVATIPEETETSTQPLSLVTNDSPRVEIKPDPQLEAKAEKLEAQAEKLESTVTDLEGALRVRDARIAELEEALQASRAQASRATAALRELREVVSSELTGIVRDVKAEVVSRRN